MARDRSEGAMLRELLRSDIGAMIESLRTDMNVQFEGVQAQLTQLDAKIDKVDAKIERRTKTLADAIAATGKRTRDGHADHERRITRLEKRGA